MGPITQFDRLLEKTSKLYQTTQRYRLRDRLLNTSGYSRRRVNSARLLNATGYETDYSIQVAIPERTGPLVRSDYFVGCSQPKSTSQIHLKGSRMRMTMATARPCKLNQVPMAEGWKLAPSTIITNRLASVPATQGKCGQRTKLRRV